MSNPAAAAVRFDVGAVKKNATTRMACGDKVTSQGPKSPLYADPEMKSSIDNVAQKTADAKATIQTYNNAHAAYLKARTALGQILAGWDSTFDVLIAAAEKHCSTPDDGAGCGLPVRDKVKFALAMPLSVTLTQNMKKNALKVHVKRAPGMRATVVQVSRDPITATSWKELDGDGAVHWIANPDPGVWYARAASKRAHGVSDFTSPVSIVVK